MGHARRKRGLKPAPKRRARWQADPDFQKNWSQVGIRHDSLSFLYSFLKPDSYAWMVWTLLRRVTIVVLYLWGPSSQTPAPGAPASALAPAPTPAPAPV